MNVIIYRNLLVGVAAVISESFHPSCTLKYTGEVSTITATQTAKVALLIHHNVLAFIGGINQESFITDTYNAIIKEFVDDTSNRHPNGNDVINNRLSEIADYLGEHYLKPHVYADIVDVPTDELGMIKLIESGCPHLAYDPNRIFPRPLPEPPAESDPFAMAMPAN